MPKVPENPTVNSQPTQASGQTNQEESAPDKTDTITNEAPTNKESTERDIVAAYREERKLRIERPTSERTATEEKGTERMAIVNKDAANVRSAPYLEAPRILTIVRGEMLTIVDEKTDQTGLKWYKVLLYNDREGWIADEVVTTTAKR